MINLLEIANILIMSQIKLKRIGTDFAFCISKQDLKAAHFDNTSEYEVIAEKGVIFLLKRKPHHTEWRFNHTGLTKEDEVWLGF